MTPSELSRPPTTTGWVPLARVRPFLIELVNRLGREEAARRMGRTPRWLWYVEHEKIRSVQRDTARRILMTLRECRSHDEVRHRKSIAHGAYLRGREEREVTNVKQLYRRTDNSDERVQRARSRPQTSGEGAPSK